MSFFFYKILFFDEFADEPYVDYVDCLSQCGHGSRLWFRSWQNVVLDFPYSILCLGMEDAFLLITNSSVLDSTHLDWPF